MQSIPPTTADKQTQAQKRRGSRSRKLLGAIIIIITIIIVVVVIVIINTWYHYRSLLRQWHSWHAKWWASLSASCNPGTVFPTLGLYSC